MLEKTIFLHYFMTLVAARHNTTCYIMLGHNSQNIILILFLKERIKGSFCLVYIEISYLAKIK